MRDYAVSRRTMLAVLSSLGAAAWTSPAQAQPAVESRQPVAIQFTLDRPLDATAAPFVMATASGLFTAEGLAVTINSATGSADAIARVATGASDFALVDINALIRWRDSK